MGMRIFDALFPKVDREVRKPLKVKIITGFLSDDPERITSAKKALSRRLGDIDIESGIMDFNYTDYYKKEFGTGLKRQFVGFEKLVSQEGLHKVKLISGDIERAFSQNGSRTVNIDPGFVNHAKLVLFTTKDYSHRLYLGSGIYAEVTLRFVNEGFEPLPWTYPDYRTPEYLSFFNEARKIFSSQIKRLDV